MKNKLNILEAYLDKVLLEAGGVHQRWFSGADEAGIEALRAVAQSNNSQFTKEGAQAEASKMGPWGGAQISAPEFDPKTGQVKAPGTVYWMSNAGELNSGSAEKVLAAIAQWKPKDAPSKDDVTDVEQGVADGTLQSTEEQQAQAEEAFKQQEAEVNDRQTNPKQVERMTKNLEQLGVEFTTTKQRLGQTEEVTLSAEEVAMGIDAACKVPPANSYLGGLLEWSRGPENKYGFGGDVNQEVMDVFDEILQTVPHIQSDDDGRYVLEEDLSEKQKDVLGAVRCRSKGLFVGYNRNGETTTSLPKLDTAMASLEATRAQEGKPTSRDFNLYGVSNKHTKHICAALGDVKVRDSEGKETPLLKASGDGKKKENNLVGTFTEKGYVGILNIMNGKGEDSMNEGVQEMTKSLQMLDKAVRASEESFDGIIPSLLSDEETEACEWYQRAERAYGIHGVPNDMVKALFMQRAMELKAIIEVAGVSPTGGREPSKEEERGNDKALGVKRDVVFEFASDKDAQKFATNLGLGKEYAHANEVDVSLKTLESMSKSINFEGCTLDVSLDNSPMEHKQQEYQDNFQNRVEYITKTNKAVGPALAQDMTKAKDWDRKQHAKIQSALSDNNTNIMPALEQMIMSSGDKNTSIAAGMQAKKDFKKFEKMVKDMNSTSDPQERKALATYVGRNMLSLLKLDKAKKDKKYAQGAAMHDVINTLASRHSEAVMRVNNGKVSVFPGDKIMDDAISAVLDGRATPQPLGGYHFKDEKGNKMFNTSYAVSREGFVRVRGTVQGRYFNEHSKLIGEENG